jgi:hypothetical protein
MSFQEAAKFEIQARNEEQELFKAKIAREKANLVMNFRSF